MRSRATPHAPLRGALRHDPAGHSDGSAAVPAIDLPPGLCGLFQPRSSSVGAPGPFFLIDSIAFTALALLL